MAGLVRATHRREQGVANFGAVSPAVESMGHRDKPGGDGGGEHGRLKIPALRALDLVAVRVERNVGPVVELSRPLMHPGIVVVGFRGQFRRVLRIVSLHLRHIVGKGVDAAKNVEHGHRRRSYVSV